MIDNPTPEAAMVETLGPLWQFVQEVHCQAMSEGCSVDQYRARMLAAIAPPPVTGGEGAWIAWDGEQSSIASGLGWVQFNGETRAQALSREPSEISYWPWYGEDERPGLSSYRLATPATGGTFADGVGAADVALRAYNQGYRDGCEDSDAEPDMELARDGWHDWLHDCAELKDDPDAIRALQPGAGRDRSE